VIFVVPMRNLLEKKKTYQRKSYRTRQLPVKQKLNEPVSLSPCFTSAKLCFWQKRVTFTKRIAALSVHVCVCVCAFRGGGTCSACMVFTNGVKDKGWVLHAPPLVSPKVTLQCAFESLCGYKKHVFVLIKISVNNLFGYHIHSSLSLRVCVCVRTHTSITMCMNSLETAFSQTKSNPCVHWWRVLSPARIQFGATETAETALDELIKRSTRSALAKLWLEQTCPLDCVQRKTSILPYIRHLCRPIYFKGKAISLWLKLCGGLWMREGEV